MIESVVELEKFESECYDLRWSLWLQPSARLRTRNSYTTDQQFGYPPIKADLVGDKLDVLWQLWSTAAFLPASPRSSPAPDTRASINEPAHAQAIFDAVPPRHVEWTSYQYLASAPDRNDGASLALLQSLHSTSDSTALIVILVFWTQ
jgi:hypothetical protein